MHSLLIASILLTYLTSQAQATSCNITTPCPRSAPCCSEFGFCGEDTFCLGGCNPFASRSLDSCRPSPVCKDASYVFTDNSRILTNATFYDGNAEEHDWIVEGGNIMNTNSSGGELALIMTEQNGGTRISSTRYVHYGTITARMKTGRWAGVVTAFITMSDIKDEIDWEFPGTATTEAQSNYFWQGVIPQGDTHGETHKGLSDTFSNYHDYTIDWQPKSLSFSIDGKVLRTIQAADAKGAGGVSNYPNTPSRVQLSLWPAGTNASAAGTVEWAGGMIDYNDPDYIAAGHFYALIKSVTVKCSDPQEPGVNITSYVYGSNTTEPTISFSNSSTLVDAGSMYVDVTFRRVGLVAAVVVGLVMSGVFF